MRNLCWGNYFYYSFSYQWPLTWPTSLGSNGRKKERGARRRREGLRPWLPSACYAGYTWPRFETEAWGNPEMAYSSRLFSQSIRSWSKTFSQGRIPLALMTRLNFSSGIWLWFVSLKLDINWFWFYHNQESSYSTLPIQVVCWTRVPYEAAVNDPTYHEFVCIHGMS